MPNFVTDGSSLPAEKSDYRTNPSVPATQKVAAVDWNGHRQALIDIQTFLRGGPWLGMAENSVDPAPAGVPDYIWLKNDGTLWITSDGIQIPVGGGGGANPTFATATINTDGDPAVLSTKMGSGSGDNIWIGNPPAGAVTTAQSVTALGAGALGANLTAGHAVAVGTNAFANLNGNALTDSVAVGARAGQFTTTGGDLTFVGYRAGEANTTGNSNTIVGSETFLVNTVGNQNTGIGAACLASCTGSNNVAVGQSALSGNSSGANNIGVGHSALAAAQTGATNLAIGYQAMHTGLVTGNNNIGIGQQAIDNLTSANDSIGVGRQVLGGSPMTGNNNVAVGALALGACTSGFVNVALGHSALVGCTQGAGNVATGRNALQGVTTGNFNTAIGDQTATGITTGSNNTIVGVYNPGNVSSQVIMADGVGNLRFMAGRNGSPEGAITAPVGAMYLRADGGAGTTLYIKESGTGNTGWIAK